MKGALSTILLLLTAAVPATSEAFAESAAPSPSGATDAAGGRIVATLRGAHRVVAWSPDGEVLGSAVTGVSPTGIVRDGDKLLIANWGLSRGPGSSMTVLDAKTFEVERTAVLCEGCAPHSLLLGADERLWWSAQKHKVVYWADAPHDAPGGSILLVGIDGWPHQLGFLSDELLFVGLSGVPHAALVDLETRTARALPLRPSPSRVLPSPRPGELYVLCTTGGAIARITMGEKDADPEVTWFVLGGLANDAAIDAAGTRLVASVVNTPRLVVFDADSGALMHSLDVPTPPRLLTVSPDGTRVAAEFTNERLLRIYTITEEGLREDRAVEIESGFGDVIWID